MKFKDIPQFTRSASYQVNQSWDSIERWVERETKDLGLDLNPDFQRGYVWTQDQKERYIEYILRGGKSGRDLQFNCVNWMQTNRGKWGPFVIVDGKQRLSAVREFLAGKVKAFGNYLHEFEDRLPFFQYDFIIHVNDLSTRAQVLQWYLDLNTGGTVHTTEEIDKVKTLIADELPAQIRYK